MLELNFAYRVWPRGAARALTRRRGIQGGGGMVEWRIIVTSIRQCKLAYIAVAAVLK